MGDAQTLVKWFRYNRNSTADGSHPKRGQGTLVSFGVVASIGIYLLVSGTNSFERVSCWVDLERFRYEVSN